MADDGVRATSSGFLALAAAATAAPLATAEIRSGNWAGKNVRGLLQIGAHSDTSVTGSSCLGT